MTPVTGNREPALVLGFPEYRVQARALARAAGLRCEDIHIHRFPDGESRLTLPAALPPQVVLCRSLDRPNEKLVELMLAAGAARELGAARLTLVAPYLCYMRQDTAFHPGEAVSQGIIGRFLAQYFTALLTVDPHLHRVHRLEQAVPVETAVALSATAPMAAYLARHAEDPLLLGPDAESEQWVAAIAREHGFDYAVAKKERLGDRDVRVHLPEAGFRGRHVVLVDDVASTGHTLAAAAAALAPQEPASVTVLVAHALFAGDALVQLERAGVQHIWSTDSIPHQSNCIPLAGLMAAPLGQILRDG